jgi:hypothetical protein
MTPANFAKHRNNPNMAFWKMLKEGNDHFEVTHQEPKVEVCDKRYVFNPEAPQQNASPVNGIRLGTPWGGLQEPRQASAALNFSAAGKCPAYVVPEDVRDAVAAKRRQDETQAAALVSRTPAAPVRTGRDGGMHPTFLAVLKPQEIREPDGTVRYVVDENAAKRLGSYVNPPLETEPVSTAIATPAPAPRAAPKPAPSTYAVASAETREAPPPAPRAQPSGNMFASLFSSNDPSPPPPPQGGMFGRVKSFFVGDDEQKPASTPQRPAKQATPAPKPAPKPHQKPEPVQAEAAPAPATAANAGLLNGAQPTVPAGSFDQRFGAIR